MSPRTWPSIRTAFTSFACDRERSVDLVNVLSVPVDVLKRFQRRVVDSIVCVPSKAPPRPTAKMASARSFRMKDDHGRQTYTGGNETMTMSGIASYVAQSIVDQPANAQQLVDASVPAIGMHPNGDSQIFTRDYTQTLRQFMVTDGEVDGAAMTMTMMVMDCGRRRPRASWRGPADQGAPRSCDRFRRCAGQRRAWRCSRARLGRNGDRRREDREPCAVARYAGCRSRRC